MRRGRRGEGSAGGAGKGGKRQGRFAAKTAAPTEGRAAVGGSGAALKGQCCFIPPHPAPGEGGLGRPIAPDAASGPSPNRRGLRGAVKAWHPPAAVWKCSLCGLGGVCVKITAVAGMGVLREPPRNSPVRLVFPVLG